MVALVVGGCGADSPEPEEVAAGVVDANAALVAGEVQDGAAAYEEALATAGELEDGNAAEEITRALEPARDAAADLATAAESLSAAEGSLAGPDRYEPELATTARDLEASAASLRAASDRLRTANRELTGAFDDSAAEIQAQDADLVAATERLRREMQVAVERADRLSRPHPHGPLRPDGIGPVDFGDPAAAAKRAFGLPGRDEEVGFGVGPAPRLDWIYRAEPGFRLIFNAGLGTVAGYTCDRGCSLETVGGIGVGDAMTTVRRAHGSALRDYPIGIDSVYLSAGRPGSFPALIFSPGFESDRLSAISAFETLAGPAGD